MLMDVQMELNGRTVADRVEPDSLLIDFLRAHGCLSVKRGCETSSCGLCTVLLDGKPILSCAMLTLRAAGHSVQTLEGLQDEAADFAGFIADQGGRRPVRLLQPRPCDEHHRPAAGEPRPHRRRDPRLPRGQPVPLLGL